MKNMWAVGVPIPTPICQLTVSASNKPSQTPKEKRKLPKLLEPQTQPKETHKAQTTNKQLSGLDVLWAMQQAQKANKPTIKRNNKKGRGRSLSSAGGRREAEEEGATDFGDVKPLCIKKEWTDKLVEFEKRLRELSPSPSQTI